MILDVGCGSRPKGDVNVDLFVEEGKHRDVMDSLDPQKIPNFVKASALYLPFRDKASDLVISNHTIEHTDDPNLMLREMLRVGKHVELNVPYGCINDWIWWRVHGHKFAGALFPHWYRECGLKVKIVFQLRISLVRGKQIPFFRYPYLEVKATL